jgi:predicted ATP-dependent protease
LHPFSDTSEIFIEEALIDQVLGQEEACAIIRQPDFSSLENPAPARVCWVRPWPH